MNLFDWFFCPPPQEPGVVSSVISSKARQAGEDPTNGAITGLSVLVPSPCFLFPTAPVTFLKTRQPFPLQSSSRTNGLKEKQIV